MNKLVTIKGKEAFTNSLSVANGVGTEHRATQQLINRYEKDLKDFGRVTFEMSPLETKGGVQNIKIYYLNEEQATFLISLMKNTKNVVQFKKELVRQFYAMKQFILEKQSSQWIETRYQGKLTRKAETDTIKKLVEYAKEQGSKNADKLYMTYSKLANRIVGVKGRDNATIVQLNNLSLAENIILHCIENGIMQDKHYKEIYQDSKARLEMFKDIAYLDEIPKIEQAV